jgi:hypothetical protein
MLKRSTIAAAALACALFGATTVASADTIGPENYDSFTPGNVDGQNGWLKTGPYDVEVENVSDYAAAAGYGFGTKSLRMSTFASSGSFGDQAFSPSLLSDAGETGASDGGGSSSGTHQTHYEVGFTIGTTVTEEQPGLAITMSPDRGDGARMSFLRFRDLPDGVHVQFVDVENPGPVGTVTADFPETDIATVSRGAPHTIRLEMDFVDGPGNDVVRVFVDGALSHTGTSWENYHRFDPEAAAGGNLVPTVDSALFRISAPAVAEQEGQGYLIDGFTLSSSTPTAPTATTPGAGDVAGQVGGAAKKQKCKKKKGKTSAAAAKKCKKKK